MQTAGLAPRGEACRLPPTLLLLSILAFPGTALALPHVADAAPAAQQARAGATDDTSAAAGGPASPADGVDGDEAAAGTAASAPGVRVEVRGVGGEVEENVRAYLSIAAVEEEANLLPSRIRRLHGEAEEEIRRALQPFGYYRPEVRTELSPAQGEDGVWTAVYEIEPGEPVRLGSVEVRLEGPGADEPELEAAVEEFPLEEGERLLHAAYREGKMFIQSRALELGYLRPTWSTSRLEVDLVEYRADVRLTLRTGPRFELGEVAFEQDAFQGRRAEEGAADEDVAEEDRFSESFLRRFVPFEPGDAFTTERLLALQQSLVQSEYFEMVEVSSLPQERDGLRVPVRVRLQAREDVRYGGGLGYGTDTGPRGTGTLHVNRINREGHRLVAEGRASLIARTISARYLLPVGGGGTDELSFAAGYASEFFEENESRAFRVGTSWSRRRGGWNQTLSLDLQEEWFRVGDDEGARTLVLGGASFSRLRSDDPIYTTRGHRLILDVDGAHDRLGSDLSILRARTEVKAIRSVLPDLRVIGRLELAGMATDLLSSVPTSLRFFAGGDRSVRGFGFQELGPRGSGGTPTGGRYLATGSLELERRLWEEWGVAAFFDAGNVYESRDAPLTLERGAGLGVRWLSPVGMVRLDLAAALTRDGTPLRLHLAVGPDL